MTSTKPLSLAWTSLPSSRSSSTPQFSPRISSLHSSRSSCLQLFTLASPGSPISANSSILHSVYLNPEWGWHFDKTGSSPLVWPINHQVLSGSQLYVLNSSQLYPCLSIPEGAELSAQASSSHQPLSPDLGQVSSPSSQHQATQSHSQRELCKMQICLCHSH